jgi:hypothetical protein
MKIFKQILLVAAVVLVSASAFAQADVKYISGLNGGTNNVSAAGTNTYTTDISAPKTANFGLVLDFKLNGAGTGNVDFKLTPTDSAGNLSTLTGEVRLYRIVANGTTTVRSITNVPALGISGYRLSIENTNAAAVTNITAKVILKTGL